MILGNINIAPLAFYNDLSLQNHRKFYAFGQIYSLITHANRILPFQVVLTNTATTINSVHLYSLNSEKVIADITSDMLANGLSIKLFEGYNLLVYPGLLPINQTVQEGRYYLIIGLNTGEIYSEVFTTVNNISGYLSLEYRNSKNFILPSGHVDFSDSFRFKCYIPSHIGKPEYVFEEEATERLGYTYIESQVSKKVYKFTFIAPEYLCDALRLVRLCDSKAIIDGPSIYEISTFGMEPKWEEQGDLAAVECEFETDTVISSIGRFAMDKGKDFNEDFNEDYQ